VVKVLQNYLGKTNAPQKLVERITTPLVNRAQTIDDLGLGYMSTSRQINTLSGGEIQRLRLAKQLGNKLTGILYVLDEPTIGLDEKEIYKVIHAIKQLQKMGNTIIVVEHNEEFIKASDWVVEIGPGAGDFGGNMVFSGSYDDFLKQDSMTAKFIRGERKMEATFDHTPSSEIVSIKNATKHNLKGINVDIRL
jgi:excinuclease ABC subunit A